ncbi:GAF domain-containing protein [Actinomadura montaniterrae]|uniref:GAF domain-containing protein n=1 Tax=Actinomadura montaniterrae TaxID=1803903 RepID=A0A6L3W6D1_9ACTN|nr:GAF domain-containing protein [Actinomadura montaniterrae]KAB2385955.1 GAF domain-containing protein [Actinomadura montaniterrae]
MNPSSALRFVTPVDTDVDRRTARLRELGLLREQPSPEFDAFATALARNLDAPIAGVNIIGPERQYFAGFHPAPDDPEDDSSRVMSCDSGFCIYVQARKRVLALDEVMDYHIFAGNPVVDAIGARSYLGAPLMDGTVVLGTVAVIDTKPRDWGEEEVAFIKAQAAELMEKIERRAARGRRPATSRAATET